MSANTNRAYRQQRNRAAVSGAKGAVSGLAGRYGGADAANLANVVMGLGEMGIRGMARKKNKKKKRKRKDKKHKRETGSGMYSGSMQLVNAPSAVGAKVVTDYRGVPHTIRHRELLTTVASSVVNGYETATFRINPGDPNTFKWLSPRATGWRYYTLKRMWVEYVPSCTTDQAGTVAMAILYDPNEQVQTNYETFVESYGATSASIWQSFIMPFDQSKLRDPAYVISTARNDNLAQQRLEDVGRVAIVVDGVSQIQQCGRVHLNYEFVFTVPNPQASCPAFSTIYDCSGLPGSAPIVTMTINTLGKVNVTSYNYALELAFTAVGSYLVTTKLVYPNGTADLTTDIDFVVDQVTSSQTTSAYSYVPLTVTPLAFHRNQLCVTNLTIGKQGDRLKIKWDDPSPSPETVCVFITQLDEDTPNFMWDHNHTYSAQPLQQSFDGMFMRGGRSHLHKEKHICEHKDIGFRMPENPGKVDPRSPWEYEEFKRDGDAPLRTRRN